MDGLIDRQLADALLATRNPDGGWGYARHRASRLEPTCWALLATPDTDPGVLVRWPVSGGLLIERSGGEPNVGFHALALLTLTALGLEHQAGNERLLRALQAFKGIPLEPFAVVRQDNSLQGWSWIPGTFSWAEPSAWSVLALKRWARRHPPDGDVAARISEGEALLFDRCCITGGWNYGNANMMGQELKAYVPTTAAGLLALQDRGDAPAVARSLAFLERSARAEPSSIALSLATLALRAFGRETRDVEDAVARQTPTTLALENTLGAAMALTALSGAGHAAFVL